MFFSRNRLVAPKIVQPGGSGHHKWWWLLGLVLLAGWSWLVFDFGRQQAGFDVSEASQIEDGLRQVVAEKEKRIEELMLESASYQRSAQIDRHSTELTKQEIKFFQQQNADLKHEVAFLNGLLSDTKKKAVLQMKNYQLSGKKDSGTYVLRFTLVHLSKVGGTAKGQVKVSISGMLAGQNKTLNLDAVTEKKLKSLKMRFKNFQNFETELKLPKDFSADSVTISSKPEGKNIEPFSQTNDWLVSGTANE